MNMAHTPDLRDIAGKADLLVGRQDGLHVLSHADAREPEFMARWRALADLSSEPNPFFEPWFLLPSLDAFAPRSSEVALLAFYRDGTLAGVMPVGKSRDYYGYPVPHAATWLHANAFYGAPLVALGCEEGFWTALFEHFDAHPGLALFLHLPHLDAAGPLNAALDLVLSRSGRPTATVARHERAMLASDASPEDYLATTLSKKHCKELQRQRRRLSEQGDLRLERRTGTYALDEWIAEFLALEAAGWKGAAGSALACHTATSAFCADTLRGAAHAGRLERLALRLDGKPIAMLTSFVCPPGSFGFKTAFDESFASFSPGMQLQIDNLATLERDDIAWSDSCAAEGHPMIDRLWTERRRLVSRNIAIGGPVRCAAFRQLMAYETRRRSQA